MVMQPIQEVQQGRESVRSAAARFDSDRSSLSACIIGKVAADATCDPHTVLSAQEESAISHLFVYTGSLYLGVTTRDLKEGVREACSDRCFVP